MSVSLRLYAQMFLYSPGKLVPSQRPVPVPLSPFLICGVKFIQHHRMAPMSLSRHDPDMAIFNKLDYRLKVSLVIPDGVVTNIGGRKALVHPKAVQPFKRP